MGSEREQYCPDVVAYRCLREIKSTGYLPRGLSGGEQPEDLALAGCQLRRSPARAGWDHERLLAGKLDQLPRDLHLREVTAQIVQREGYTMGEALGEGQIFRAGLPVSSYEMRIKTRSGHRRWVNVSNLSVDTGDGPYLVHLLRDSQGTHETLEMARGLIRLSSKEEATREGGSLDSRDVPALTSRQLEVLGLIARGNTVREISKSLYL